MSEASSVILGVPRETYPGENRVAMVPAVVPVLAKSGINVWIERGAGEPAGYRDADYETKGARLASRDEIFSSAQIIAHVRVAGANPSGAEDARRYRQGQIVIGMADPLGEAAGCRDFASTGATLIALELLPRITRAQSMDVLSSMASIAGYKAVLLAADALPRIIPMMMTAAGTVDARARVRDRRRRGRAPGHRHREAHGCRGARLRRASRREGTGHEPGRQVRGAAAGNHRRRGQGRLREGAGRRLLSQAARADGEAWWPRATS